MRVQNIGAYASKLKDIFIRCYDEVKLYYTWPGVQRL